MAAHTEHDHTEHDHTEPDGTTTEAERVEAGVAHQSDRAATPEEATEADDRAASEDSDRRAEVAAHEREMNSIGANVKGEGQIV